MSTLITLGLGGTAPELLLAGFDPDASGVGSGTFFSRTFRSRTFRSRTWDRLGGSSGPGSGTFHSRTWASRTFHSRTWDRFHATPPPSSGHGKSSVGVPNIGHQGPTSDAIRRWLRKAREKQAKRQAAADKRQSELIARYEATASLPTRIRLRVRTTIRTDHSSPVAFYTPPTPHTVQSLSEIAAVHSFPVALLEPSLHNMHSETTIAVSHGSRVAFKDMARVHAQDQAMLSAILARLMLEE